MKILDKDLNDLDNDALIKLKNEQQLYLENGEVLLNALLNMPFKKPEKVKSLIENIEIYKKNIDVIDEKISGYKNMVWYDDAKLHFGYTYSPKSHPKYNVEYTTIKILNETNKYHVIEIIDDMFISVLGVYYTMDVNGQYIPISKIVDFCDYDSKIYKWYDSMCLSFSRELKLNKIIDDESI